MGLEIASYIEIVWTDSLTLMRFFPNQFIAPVMVAVILTTAAIISRNSRPSTEGYFAVIISLLQTTFYFVILHVMATMFSPMLDKMGVATGPTDTERNVASGLVALFNVALIKGKAAALLVWMLVFAFLNGPGQAVIEGATFGVSFDNATDRANWVFAWFLILWNLVFYGMRWLVKNREEIMYNLTIPLWFAALVGGLYVLPAANGALLSAVLLLGFPVVLAIQYKKGVDKDIVSMYAQGVKLIPNTLQQISRLFYRS